MISGKNNVFVIHVRTLKHDVAKSKETMLKFTYTQRFLQHMEETGKFLNFRL
jgi:hypothetical protein